MKNGALLPGRSSSSSSSSTKNRRVVLLLLLVAVLGPSPPPPPDGDSSCGEASVPSGSCRAVPAGVWAIEAAEAEVEEEASEESNLDVLPLGEDDIDDVEFFDVLNFDDWSDEERADDVGVDTMEPDDYDASSAGGGSATSGFDAGPAATASSFGASDASDTEYEHDPPSSSEGGRKRTHTMQWHSDYLPEGVVGDDDGPDGDDGPTLTLQSLAAILLEDMIPRGSDKCRAAFDNDDVDPYSPTAGRWRGEGEGEGREEGVEREGVEVAAGGGRTTTTFEFTPSGESDWAAVNADSEKDVFLAEMRHDDVGDAENRSWTVRFGQGGNIYSFRGPYGQAVPPQTMPNSAWIDEVWQMVDANVDMNRKGETSQRYPWFIHGAGAYAHDPRGGLRHNPGGKHFYSPSIGARCGERECSFASWAQHGWVPTPYKSNVLHFNSYRDCDNGVLEWTSVRHHSGDPFSSNPDPPLDWIHAPWGGVRTSSLLDVTYADSVDGSLGDPMFPLKGWAERGFSKYTRTFGGYTTFAQDLPKRFPMVCYRVRVDSEATCVCSCGGNNSTNSSNDTASSDRGEVVCRSKCSAYGDAYNGGPGNCTSSCMSDHSGAAAGANATCRPKDASSTNETCSVICTERCKDPMTEMYRDRGRASTAHSDRPIYLPDGICPDHRAAISSGGTNSAPDAWHRFRLVVQPDTRARQSGRPIVAWLFPRGYFPPIIGFDLECPTTKVNMAYVCDHVLRGYTFTNARTKESVDVRRIRALNAGNDTVNKWDGLTIFDTDASAEEFNAVFKEGDEILVGYRRIGDKSVEDNLALTVVHGVDDDDVGYAPSLLRVGVNRRLARDYTVFTNVLRANVYPGDTHIFRQYFLTDRYVNTAKHAREWINETYQDIYNYNDFNGRELKVYTTNDESSFAIVAKGTCHADPCSTLKCTGTSTPTSGYVPFFYITCSGSSNTYVGPDKYHFAPVDEISGVVRPYICDENDLSIQPVWTLIGYFPYSDGGNKCAIPVGARYDETLCNHHTPRNRKLGESLGESKQTGGKSKKKVLKGGGRDGKTYGRKTTTEEVVKSGGKTRNHMRAMKRSTDNNSKEKKKSASKKSKGGESSLEQVASTSPLINKDALVNRNCDINYPD